MPFTSETTVELVTTPAYTTAAVSGDKDTPTTTLGMAPILGITIGVSALPLLLVIITMLLRRKSGATSRNKDRVAGGEPAPSRPE